MIYNSSTDTHGLKYRPKFMIPEWDDADCLNEYNQYVESQHPLPLYHGALSFTKANFDVLENVVKTSNPMAILEIGVARDHPELNSTNAILRNKALEAKYLGIDLRGLQHLFDKNKNEYFLQSNSFDQLKVRSKLQELNINELDLLFIDGWHSMNAFHNDWLYTDLLKVGGYVVFHDTTHHPGPREFFEAIDEEFYEKTKYCPEDYGIAVARRIK